jgi:ferredoxin
MIPRSDPNVSVTIRVDRSTCSGIGSSSELIAPSVLEIDESGQSHALNDHPSGADRHTAEQAVSTCPTGALSIGD